MKWVRLQIIDKEKAGQVGEEMAALLEAERFQLLAVSLSPHLELNPAIFAWLACLG